ncbi:hypothetical protein VTL71DRAFT_4851 [Oculimacula yallundae]|uniref:2EXR domain-containing protein n=1 Tax=Oculimacula yallundae TaxID=86028 RepID=A0ABR4C352_9HELO
MASHSQLLKTPACLEFQLFPLLPSELRIKIWKLSFIPRHVLMWSARDRLGLDTLMGKFLLVNFEARQVFLESYSRCFYQKGQKATYLNFDIDTLTFRAGINTLQKMIRHYPTDMAKVQRIDVPGRARGPWEDHLTFHMDMMGKLAALKHITVRVDRFGTNEINDHRPEHESGMVAVADRIRHSLLSCVDPGRPYNGPRLAIIFPRTEDWMEHTYFTTDKSLTSASYGCLVWKDEVKDGWGYHPQQIYNHGRNDKFHWLPDDEFTVSWIKQEVPWSTGSSEGIFRELRTSRTPRSRQSRRDFWDHISSYDHEYHRHVLLMERQTREMCYEEEWELSRVTEGLLEMKERFGSAAWYSTPFLNPWEDLDSGDVRRAIIYHLACAPIDNSEDSIRIMSDILSDCEEAYSMLMGS